MHTLCPVIAQVNCKQAVKFPCATSCQTVGFSTNHRNAMCISGWVSVWMLGGGL